MAPRLFVPAPTTAPARYGLVTAADQVVPEDPDKFRLGIEWQQLPPADRVKVVELEECASSPAIEFDGPFGFTTSDPLFLRTAVRVKAPGVTDEQIRSYVRALLLAGESPALEAAYWASPSVRSFTAGATDLGSVASVAEAVGALEDHAWRKMNGLGVIHAQRRVAAVAAREQLVDKSGGQLVTPLENRWSFGAYPQAGKLAITGRIAFRASEVEVFPLDRGVGAFDPATNWLTYVAERAYVLAHDGPPAVVTVTP